MFCPKCGTNVENGTRFCSECGTDVLAAQAVPAGNAPAPQYTQNTYSAPPPPPPRPQPQYAPPQYAPQYQQPVNPNDAPMSVGSYIGTMILFCIPLVGFILQLVWAFGSNVNRNKKNFCRAALILEVIVVVLYIIFFIIVGASIMTMFRSGGYSSVY